MVIRYTINSMQVLRYSTRVIKRSIRLLKSNSEAYSTAVPIVIDLLYFPPNSLQFSPLVVVLPP